MKHEEQKDKTVNEIIQQLIELLNKLYKELEYYEPYNTKKNIWLLYDNIVTTTVKIEKTWDSKIDTFVENFLNRT